MAQKKRTLKKLPWWVILCVCACIIAVCAVGYFWLRAPMAVNKTVVTSPSPSVTPSGTPLPSTASDAGPDRGGTPAPTPTGISNVELPAPTGPNLNTFLVSLSSGNTTVNTVCGEISGASCYIQASNGTKTLNVSGTKTIPSGQEAVVLPWNANQLSFGNWQIEVIATLGSQRQVSSVGSNQTLTVTK